LFAAWILESQLMHRKAESARQNNVAVADLHESQSFEAIEEEDEEGEYEDFEASLAFVEEVGSLVLLDWWCCGNGLLSSI
jgi:hypothetical protein